MEDKWSDRIFIHMTTAIRYQASMSMVPPPRPSTSMHPVYDYGQKVVVRRVEGEPDAGMTEVVEGDDLVEETPALRAVLLAHADHPYEAPYYLPDVGWQRHARRVNSVTIDLREFNPYLRQKRQRKEAGGTHMRLSEDGIEYLVDNNTPEGAYDEFTRDKQPIHIVDLWLRAGGYNMTTMGSLARANKYLAGVMRNDLPWVNALEYHHGGGAVRCMGPLNNRAVHPWIRTALDATTTNADHRGQRYGKRLLELIRRHGKTTRVTQTFPAISEMINQDLSKYPKNIWQCGEHIYGLFSKRKNDTKGQFLAYWNARTEEPLRPLTFVDMVEGNRLKFNLLGKEEQMQLLDWDQEGFVALVTDDKGNVINMLYVRASAPIFQHTGSKGFFRRRSVQEWLEHHVLPHGMQSAKMTPRFICVDGNLLLKRGSGNTVNTEDAHTLSGAIVIGVVAFDTVLVRLHDDHYYLVTDILAYPLPDQQQQWWRRLVTPVELGYYRALVATKKERGLANLLCHWKQLENRLVWCDYEAFNREHRFERACMPQLDLTSVQIQGTVCVTCGVHATTADAELGHVLCSAACQTAWYANH